MAFPLLRIATGLALLALGACAQRPPTVVIDASGLAPPVAFYAPYQGLSETDEVFAPEPPLRPLPRPVAPPRPILVPNPVYLPVYPPAPGGGGWIPVVQ